MHQINDIITNKDLLKMTFKIIIILNTCSKDDCAVTKSQILQKQNKDQLNINQIMFITWIWPKLHGMAVRNKSE
jgi:hypothetical protein